MKYLIFFLLSISFTYADYPELCEGVNIDTNEAIVVEFKIGLI